MPFNVFHWYLFEVVYSKYDQNIKQFLLGLEKNMNVVQRKMNLRVKTNEKLRCNIFNKTM